MNELKRPISAIILVILVGLGGYYVSFIKHSELRSSLYSEFAVVRDTVKEAGLQTNRGSVSDEYDKLIENCSNRDEYYDFINSDSRSLSEEGLVRALELHNECGTYFWDRKNINLDIFTLRLEELGRVNELLKETSASTMSAGIFDAWNNIFNLEKEHNTIFREMIDIQKQYWQIELNRVRGEITALEREAQIGALNNQARINNKRISDVVNILKEKREEEESKWKSFIKKFIAPKESTEGTE